MSTGFDPYGGPMMMMPYASANSQPFSINPIEFYDNTQNATPYQNDKKISTDSQLVRIFLFLTTKTDRKLTFFLYYLSIDC